MEFKYIGLSNVVKRKKIPLTKKKKSKPNNQENGSRLVLKITLQFFKCRRVFLVPFRSQEIYVDWEYL